MARKVFPAKLNRLDDAIAFVDEQLDRLDCPIKTRSAIDVAIEEIFVNVAHYAYPGCEGDAAIEVKTVDNGVEIEITDEGMPFDPLAIKDPDISLPSQDRKIGGLGIYMVKKMMDSVAYRYCDNKNILTMTKYF